MLPLKADLHISIEDDYGDAFHDDWIQLSPNDVDFNSYVFMDSDLPTCGLFSIDQLCDDCVGGGSSGEHEDGDEHDLEQVPSFAEAHTAYKTVKPFFYVHNISDHDK
jgi:hypothetical protein